MQMINHPWPKQLPRRFKPTKTLFAPNAEFCDYLARCSPVDRAALANAYQLEGDSRRIKNLLPGIPMYTLGSNGNDTYSAIASTASETSYLAGGKIQPTIPPNFFDLVGGGVGRGFTLEGWGVLSTTGTPTMIFQTRMSSSQGSGTLSGVSLGVSVAVTTGSGVTNKQFYLRLDAMCSTSGQGGTNTTLQCTGFVLSPGGGSSASGFASPFCYSLEPTTPDTATWTAGADSTQQYYLNMSMTWSANSSSNTSTLKMWRLTGWL